MRCLKRDKVTVHVTDERLPVEIETLQRTLRLGDWDDFPGWPLILSYNWFEHKYVNVLEVHTKELPDTFSNI